MFNRYAFNTAVYNGEPTPKKLGTIILDHVVVLVDIWSPRALPDAENAQHLSAQDRPAITLSDQRQSIILG